MPEPKKMKILILSILLMVLCPIGTAAQQVITFKSGYTCKAVITYISADSVRYQLINDPNVTLTAPMSMVEKITDAGDLVSRKDTTYYNAKLKKFTTMTIAGGAVLGAGAILTVVGITGLKNHPEEYNSYYDDNSERKTYTAITAVSTIVAITGSVFTIVGGSNVGAAKKELRKLKVQVEPNPMISGITVRLRF